MTVVENVLFDIFTLSHLDFVVCTFSSNVGRLVYQLRSTRDPDVVSNVVSVDVPNWYADRLLPPILFVAKANHTGRSDLGEMSFQNGDHIVEGYSNTKSDLPHGIIYGSNKRTLKKGLFPLFKTEKMYQNLNKR